MNTINLVTSIFCSYLVYASVCIFTHAHRKISCSFRMYEQWRRELIAVYGLSTASSYTESWIWRALTYSPREKECAFCSRYVALDVCESVREREREHFEPYRTLSSSLRLSLGWKRKKNRLLAYLLALSERYTFTCNAYADIHNNIYSIHLEFVLSFSASVRSLFFYPIRRFCTYALFRIQQTLVCVTVCVNTFRGLLFSLETDIFVHKSISFLIYCQLIFSFRLADEHRCAFHQATHARSLPLSWLIPSTLITWHVQCVHLHKHKHKRQVYFESQHSIQIISWHYILLQAMNQLN